MFFLSLFYRKPIKGVSEVISLGKVSIACSQGRLLYLKKMSKNNEQRYHDLVNLFEKAYSTLETKKQYRQAQELSNSVKNDPNVYEKKRQELKLKAAQFKGLIMSFGELHCRHDQQRSKKITHSINNILIPNFNWNNVKSE